MNECLDQRLLSNISFILESNPHDDIKWKHFPRNWPFVRGIHRSCRIPRTKAGDAELMFSLICAWINDWVNNREAGDLRRHRGHYDVNVMVLFNFSCHLPIRGEIGQGGWVSVSKCGLRQKGNSLLMIKRSYCLYNFTVGIAILGNIILKNITGSLSGEFISHWLIPVTKDP